MCNLNCFPSIRHCPSIRVWFWRLARPTTSHPLPFLLFRETHTIPIEPDCHLRALSKQEDTTGSIWSLLISGKKRNKNKQRRKLWPFLVAVRPFYFVKGCVGRVCRVDVKSRRFRPAWPICEIEPYSCNCLVPGRPNCGTCLSDNASTIGDLLVLDQLSRIFIII